MVKINYIKELYEVDGLSLSEIRRKTGYNWRTVKKYTQKDDFSPKIKVGVAERSGDYPVLGAFIPIIDEWLEADANEPRKQRHTITRIFERLCKEHGFEGSYGSVKKYVNKVRQMAKRSSEGFLPISQPAAHAQVDFGHFKYYDALGFEQKGYALVVSFPYSNAAWVQVYQSENQECLLTGLKSIFAHIGASPRLVRFDNMSTAVVKVLAEGERILTEGFIRFKLHYRFRAEFCNPARGNEKGNVENKVGYTRRNMLVPVPTITDFEEFNKQLLARCDCDLDREHYRHPKTLNELWLEEKPSLLTLPAHEYDVFRYENCAVNKYGFMSIDKVKYGLSPSMAGTIVQVKIYFDKIEAYHDHCLLKTFKRSYEENTEVYDWREYLPDLAKKPGAIPHTRFFDQMPKLWQGHLKSIASSERKSALSVLMEIVDDGNCDLSDEALEIAVDNGRTDADSIRQCYYLISRKEHHPSPLELPSNPTISGYVPDLTAYDVLFVNRLGDGQTLDGGIETHAEIEICPRIGGVKA